jgi:hypothetical protein
VEPFPRRLVRGGAAQRWQHLGVPAERQPGLSPVLQDAEPALPEAGADHLARRVHVDAVQHRPVPQAERPLPVPGGRDEVTARGGLATLARQPIEERRVQVVRPNLHHVPRGEGYEPRATGPRAEAEGGAHGRRVRTQRAGGRPGCPHRPQQSGQPVDADRLVGVQQQDRQQRARLRGAQPGLLTVLVACVEHAEDPETDPVTHAHPRSHPRSSVGPSCAPVKPALDRSLTPRRDR